MLLDAASAKALAVILIVSNQGDEILKAQLPLQVIDQGRTWLIKGTPFTDTVKGLDFCLSHVIICMTDAEVVDFGLSGRMALTPAQRTYWQAHMRPDEFDGVFGLRTSFEPPQLESTPSMDVTRVLNGGLVNTPDAALQYALVLMHAARPDLPVGLQDLHAVETAGVWHVTKRDGGKSNEVLTISRRTGKVFFDTP